MSMKEQIFKIDDRVFNCHIGWGKIIKEDYTHPTVLWDDGEQGYCPKIYLSFTEYTLKGFSQERPEELPNEGDIVWVRNADPGIWAIGHFYKKIDDYFYVSNSVGEKEWSRRGLEITTKNPYENRED